MDVEIRTRYGPVVKQSKDCVAEGGPSMTKQSFVEECDINTIVERYERLGGIGTPEEVQRREAAFGDFSGVTDYMDAQNRVLAAREAFAGLSARIRDRFQNSIPAVLEFLGDERNRQEAVDLGIVTKPVDVLGGVAPVAPPVAPLTT